MGQSQKGHWKGHNELLHRIADKSGSGDLIVIMKGRKK
jgi:hypothetical protein